VPPGEYTLMVDFQMVTPAFTVEPGASMDVGTVEVER
jgi:hypothetical protein